MKMMNCRSDLDYCEIFGDCFHCPGLPFCPYEKLEDGTEAGWEPEEETTNQDEGR